MRFPRNVGLAANLNVRVYTFALSNAVCDVDMLWLLYEQRTLHNSARNKSLIIKCISDVSCFYHHSTARWLRISHAVSTVSNASVSLSTNLLTISTMRQKRLVSLYTVP